MARSESAVWRHAARQGETSLVAGVGRWGGLRPTLARLVSCLGRASLSASRGSSHRYQMLAETIAHRRSPALGFWSRSVRWAQENPANRDADRRAVSVLARWLAGYKPSSSPVCGPGACVAPVMQLGPKATERRPQLGGWLLAWLMPGADFMLTCGCFPPSRGLDAGWVCDEVTQ